MSTMNIADSKEVKETNNNNNNRGAAKQSKEQVWSKESDYF